MEVSSLVALAAFLLSLLALIASLCNANQYSYNPATQNPILQAFRILIRADILWSFGCVILWGTTMALPPSTNPVICTSVSLPLLWGAASTAYASGSVLVAAVSYYTLKLAPTRRSYHVAPSVVRCTFYLSLAIGLGLGVLPVVTDRYRIYSDLWCLHDSMLNVEALALNILNHLLCPLAALSFYCRTFMLVRKRKRRSLTPETPQDKGRYLVATSIARRGCFMVLKQLVVVTPALAAVIYRTLEIEAPTWLDYLAVLLPVPNGAYDFFILLSLPHIRRGNGGLIIPVRATTRDARYAVSSTTGQSNGEMSPLNRNENPLVRMASSVTASSLSSPKVVHAFKR
eukprot:GILK01006114.1.p1 GENE.GILK01006114.1~~GILK01006114.1.p1  ORF type:complete len:356 (+),score=14.65 GILK01006114.1:40-1068(+)